MGFFMVFISVLLVVCFVVVVVVGTSDCHNRIVALDNNLSSISRRIEKQEKELGELVSQMAGIDNKLASKANKRRPRSKKVIGLTPTTVVAPLIVSDKPRLFSLEQLETRVDRYRIGNKSGPRIGAAYERFVAFMLFARGYRVAMNGVDKGLADKGIDLIATKGNTGLLIQTKCWSKNYMIREKYIHQLYGSIKDYNSENKTNYKGVLTTTTSLSSEATEAAGRLGIAVRPLELDKNYPLVKEFLFNGHRVYILPGDAGYDDAGTSGYFNSCKEAEGAGLTYKGNLNA